MKKMFASLLVLTSLTAGAQIPTIDVSSLQQLYAQYRVMEQQLSTSKDILGEATKIYNQEVQTYETALGNIDKVRNRLQGWLQSFRRLTSTDFFAGRAAPVQNFQRNVTSWYHQLARGSRDLADLESRWEQSVQRVAEGRATDWERQAALGGYNSKLIENTSASRQYSSNALAQAQSVVDEASDGTLIEQAGAQNALLYQQTALLDRMKNDINDATVAEAAQREAALQAQRDEQVIRKALSNIPTE